MITAAEFHPTECNLLIYSSSKGTLRLCDMRSQALCDRHAKCKQPHYNLKSISTHCVYVHAKCKQPHHILDEILDNAFKINFQFMEIFYIIISPSKARAWFCNWLFEAYAPCISERLDLCSSLYWENRCEVGQMIDSLCSWVVCSLVNNLNASYIF